MSALSAWYDLILVGAAAPAQHDRRCTPQTGTINKKQQSATSLTLGPAWTCPAHGASTSQPWQKWRLRPGGHPPRAQSRRRGPEGNPTREGPPRGLLQGTHMCTQHTYTQHTAHKPQHTAHRTQHTVHSTQYTHIQTRRPNPYSTYKKRGVTMAAGQTPTPNRA